MRQPYIRGKTFSSTFQSGQFRFEELYLENDGIYGVLLFPAPMYSVVFDKIPPESLMSSMSELGGVVIRTALPATVITLSSHNKYPAPTHSGLVSVMVSQKMFRRRSDCLIT